MIEVKTKVHDRYSLELKTGFIPDDGKRKNDFRLGMWLFVPSSLDITPASFTKNEFYRCVKSNLRLKTPSCSLEQIASRMSELKSGDPAQYDKDLKQLCAIIKSSLRDSRDDLASRPTEEASALSVRNLHQCGLILDRFFTLEETKIHGYCGEFLCNVMASHCFKLSHLAENEAKELLARVQEIRKARGYAQVRIDDPEGNRDFIHRKGVLKKIVESGLYLRVPRKRDGTVVEQMYYSLAAGFAMLFATVVAWGFQSYFGNLTWPLFIALIISYMMKDRIKELMRYYFAHRVGSRYYDNKARIDIDGENIGWLKEAMDFIPHENVPEEVLAHRNSVHLFDAENEFISENVILYRKMVHLTKDVDINDITRLQVRPFLRKMDDPTQLVGLLDEDGEIKYIDCDKDYYINIIIRCEYGETVEFRRLRLTLNNTGIKSAETV